MTDVPPDFTVPEHLQLAVKAALERYSRVGDTLADELMAIGLPWDQASTIAVDCLVRNACEMAMEIALAENREPRLERWQEVTSQTFAQVHANWMAAISSPWWVIL